MFRSGLCPSVWVCLLVISVFSVLLSLGFWQLDRAKEKQGIIETRSAQSENSPLLRLPDLGQYEELRHRLVDLRGEFQTQRQFLLDNQIRKGKPGFSVLTPFLTESGQWILVDRGWVPLGQTRQLLPNVEMIEAGQSRLQGVVYVPYGEPYALGEFSDSVAWPMVVQYLDFAAASGKLGQSLLPLVVRMSPESDDGYFREWSVLAMGPEKHIGYAVQWFSMAAVFAVLVFIVWRKRAE